MSSKIYNDFYKGKYKSDPKSFYWIAKHDPSYVIFILDNKYFSIPVRSLFRMAVQKVKREQEKENRKAELDRIERDRIRQEAATRIWAEKKKTKEEMAREAMERHTMEGVERQQKEAQARREKIARERKEKAEFMRQKAIKDKQIADFNKKKYEAELEVAKKQKQWEEKYKTFDRYDGLTGPWVVKIDGVSYFPSAYRWIGRSRNGMPNRTWLTIKKDHAPWANEHIMRQYPADTIYAVINNEIVKAWDGYEMKGRVKLIYMHGSYHQLLNKEEWLTTLSSRSKTRKAIIDQIYKGEKNHTIDDAEAFIRAVNIYMRMRRKDSLNAHTYEIYRIRQRLIRQLQPEMDKVGAQQYDDGFETRYIIQQKLCIKIPYINRSGRAAIGIFYKFDDTITEEEWLNNIKRTWDAIGVNRQLFRCLYAGEGQIESDQVFEVSGFIRKYTTSQRPFQEIKYILNRVGNNLKDFLIGLKVKECKGYKQGQKTKISAVKRKMKRKETVIYNDEELEDVKKRKEERRRRYEERKKAKTLFPHQMRVKSRARSNSFIETRKNFKDVQWKLLNLKL